MATGAEFTFTSKCDQCGVSLRKGFARCPACRALRLEFAGWEHCVVDTPGACCLSGATANVLAPDGNYYWAPYFIDLVRAGKFNAQ